MSNDILSPQRAKDIVVESLILSLYKSLYRRVRYIENPAPDLLSKSNVFWTGKRSRDPSNCHCFYVDPERMQMGGDRLICVDKHTGEIVFDRIVGN